MKTSLKTVGRLRPLLRLSVIFSERLVFSLLLNNKNRSSWSCSFNDNEGEAELFALCAPWLTPSAIPVRMMIQKTVGIYCKRKTNDFVFPRTENFSFHRNIRRVRNLGNVKGILAIWHEAEPSCIH